MNPVPPRRGAGLQVLASQWRNGMNWKKLLTFAGAGAVAGSLGHYVTELQQGHAMAFTAGNIVVPMVTSLASTLLALFVKPPHQDQ
jgi:hypothetical protein